MPSYEDPEFLARLVNLMVLLDKRELDTYAALAFYALSVIDWQSHDPGPIFSSLDVGVTARLASGRSKTMARNFGVIQAILKHQCNGSGSTFSVFTTQPPANAGGSLQASDICQKTKDAALEAIIPHLQGDFLHALYTYFPAPGMVNCVSVQTIMKNWVNTGTSFSLVAADFGFPRTLTTLWMPASS